MPGAPSKEFWSSGSVVTPGMASGAKIPSDDEDEEGHGARQTGVGLPLIPGVGCTW